MLPSLMQQQPQPNATGAGMSTDSMKAMMDKAKMFTDGELADILMGKSMAIPQFVAMTEAMGRKQLRTAVEGQMAGQQAQQPTVKDMLMSDEERAALAEQPEAQPSPAEAQGLAALPAKNMEPTEKSMAAGGIIAFSGKDGSEVYDPNAISLPEVSGADKKLWESIKEKFSEWNQPWAPPTGATPAQISGLRGGRLPAGSLEAEAKRAESVPNAVAQGDVQNRDDYRSAPAPVAPAAPVTKPTGIQTIANQTDLAAIQKRVDPSLAKKVAEENPDAPPKPPRVDNFAGMEPDKDELAKKIQSEKDFAAGQYLMSMGQALMSVPNIGQAMAKGNELGLPGLVASRKTINDLEKNQRDYTFQLNKAKEARDQGNEELALKHEELAQKVLYQTGVLAVENRKAGADELRAGAYAGSVQSKGDLKKEKLDEAIGRGAVEMHAKNMADFTFARNFGKMSPEQKQQYFSDLRQQASGLYGKNENVAGSGYSMSDIDAAIARKEKKS
jgi:hypothetical protein